MNDVMIDAPSDASEVSDLCGVSLAELPARPATAAVAARAAYKKVTTQAFATGAFNSYI